MSPARILVLSIVLLAASAAAQTPPGFVPLFNGQDLTGWKGWVAGPEQRAQMTPEALAAAQAVADESMRAHWSVVDGVLTFDGAGANLCTEKDYGDFELLVDWKIAPGGDSGIFLRSTPQVQIWDPDNTPELSRAGSGGLPNNVVNPGMPLCRADKPVGEWNTFRIKMVGDRVTVYLNDALVVNNVAMENAWNSNLPLFATGLIELQSRQTPLWFRNVFIREFPRIGAVEYQDDAGFVPLFDGSLESLQANWITTGNVDAWRVEEGVLRTDGVAGGDWLRTVQQYGNFVLRLEWMVPDYGNSGIQLRDAFEIQILAPWHPYRPDLNCTGAIYGHVPVTIRPDDSPYVWHSFEITCQSTRIGVVSDGLPCVDADLSQTPSLKDMPVKGYISLQSCHTHAGEKWVKFRNIRVKALE